MLDATAFVNWTKAAEPGDRVVYFVGQIDRAREDPAIAALSDVAYGMADAAYYRNSPCQHVRGLQFGTGEVALFQTRRESGPGFVYVAERK